MVVDPLTATCLSIRDLKSRNMSLCESQHNLLPRQQIVGSVTRRGDASRSRMRCFAIDDPAIREQGRHQLLGFQVVQNPEGSGHFGVPMFLECPSARPEDTSVPVSGQDYLRLGFGSQT